jgi:hypothetical protein
LPIPYSCLGLPPVGQAVRACGDLRQAGPHASVLARARGQGAGSGLMSGRAGLWYGQFSGRRDWGSNVFGSLLLFADNYIQQLRTKTQSAQRTQIALFGRNFCSLHLCDPCGPLAAAPGSPIGRLVFGCALCRLWARAVRACGDVVRAGICARENSTEARSVGVGCHEA